MAAPPDRTKVSPAMPMNSASSRRSRWSGLAQSAQPRWPPTEAIRAALPTGSAPWAGARGLDPEAPAAGFAPGLLMSGFARVRRDIGGARAGEVDRDDDAVEQFLADALGQGGLLEGEVVVDGVVGDGRGLVVADDRRQGGHHHYRPVDVLFQLRLVQLGALDHELPEVVAHIGHDQRGVQVVVDQDRAEGV